MSLSSYFTKKKQYKKNYCIDQESKVKSNSKNIDVDVDDAGKSSQNANYHEEFSFQFFNNMSNGEKKRDDSPFKFAFHISNKDDNAHKNSKRKRRKRKTKSTMSNMLRDEKSDVGQQKQQNGNQCMKLEEPNAPVEVVKKNIDNYHNNTALPSEKERKGKKKSKKKKSCRSIVQMDNKEDFHEIGKNTRNDGRQISSNLFFREDDEHKESENFKNDEDEVSNLQAMESFVEASATLVTDEIQNYPRNESNHDRTDRQQMNNIENSNEKKVILYGIDDDGDRHMQGDKRGNKNTLSVSNMVYNPKTDTAIKKNIQNKVHTVASIASKKRKKSKKPLSIQRQAQLNLQHEKQSLSKHRKSKKKAQDRILQFNSADRGKAMVNHGSLAVHREKTKLLKQQQQRNNDEKDRNLQKESNPFSFGFHFNSLLPQSPENFKI